MMPKKVRGLSLISPGDAIKTLMNKLVIQALLPRLRYRITQLQPSPHSPWGHSSLWLFSPQFSIKGGSKAWHHVTQSWKVMAKMVIYLPPIIPEYILQLNL
jgi:hypothetical protein